MSVIEHSPPMGRPPDESPPKDSRLRGDGYEPAPWRRRRVAAIAVAEPPCPRYPLAPESPGHTFRAKWWWWRPWATPAAWTYVRWLLVGHVIFWLPAIDRVVGRPPTSANGQQRVSPCPVGANAPFRRGARGPPRFCRIALDHEKGTDGAREQGVKSYGREVS